MLIAPFQTKLPRPLVVCLLLLTLTACGGASGPASPSPAMASSPAAPASSAAMLTVLPVKKGTVRFIGPYGEQIFDEGGRQFHNGFDLGAPSGTAYYAAADGKVEEIVLDTGEGLPGTNYSIALDVGGGERVGYHFELDGSVAESERRANIFVSEGQSVKAGQHLANLLSQGSGAHVHFGVTIYGEAECPLDAFTDTAAAAFEALYDSGIEKRPANRADLCE